MVKRMTQIYGDKGNVSGKYRILMAKAHQETEELWLPLWMHLRDTAGIIKKLVVKWVPESVFSSAGLGYEDFLSTAVFLAAVHDIGKATSIFQSMITRFCPAKYEEISGYGYQLCKEYREKGKTPHAHAGQWILQSDTVKASVPESVAAVVGAHHGKPLSIDYMMGEPDMIKAYPANFWGSEDEEVKRLWKEAWYDILNQAMELAGIKTFRELPVLTLEAQVLLSGLLITADWISSNTTYFPLLSLDDCGEGTMYPERVNKGWKKVDFPEGWHSEVYTMDQEIFKERFGFQPNEVQRCVLNVVDSCSDAPGIFVLEAGMGVGKTEAALAAAEVLASRKNEGGIFFGLPTQATSNGLFPRLYQWGKQVSEETANAIRLAHGAAEFNEDYNRLIMEGNSSIEEDGGNQDKLGVHPWFQGNKRALLADFVIGTVDQFLMASLKRKHFMLRHMGLAGKVVVIDECHAYDAYMNIYLEASLQWMAAYGVPVILLSATLPANRRKALVECYVKAYSKYRLGKRKPKIICRDTDWGKNMNYPLLTWSEGEEIRQENIEQEESGKIVKIHRGVSLTDMARLLDERLQEGGCASIIVNTVAYAQTVYEQCRESIENAEFILYHAQFTMPDRFKKEEYLLRKMGKNSGSSDRNRLILVGTQVLEQSLDYDADIMVTQLCPMDLLLQRMGRLHRHKRFRPKRLQSPECIILQEGGEAYDSGSQAVYGDYLLMRTEKVLPDIIKIPGHIPSLVQKVYSQEDSLGLEGEGYKRAKEQYEKELKTKEQRAKGYLLNKTSRRGLENILDNAEESSEKIAEASVRDGASSIEVLLMKEGKDETVLFAEGDFSKSFIGSKTQVPISTEGRMIAMQRLRLPHVFACSWNKRDTIRELEEKNIKELSMWQQSPWIHGELVLLLNEQNQAELNGYRLSYSFEKGLEYEKRI